MPTGSIIFSFLITWSYLLVFSCQLNGASINCGKSWKSAVCFISVVVFLHFSGFQTLELLISEESG